MSNSCNSVKIFEGLTLDQLDDFISGRVSEYVPLLGPVIALFEDDAASRKDILRNLKYIIQGGDPNRVDRGEEAIGIAAFFRDYSRCGVKIDEADIQNYTEDYYRETYDKKRAEIAERYDLSDDFVFSSIATEIPIELYPTFRGSQVFDSLADALPTFLAGISAERKINILYPAAGNHIAPLLTAMRLIDNGSIDEASFVYTEIDKNSFYNLYYLLRMALDKGIFDEVSAGSWKEFNGEGSERDLAVRYKGQLIRIKFALNRSGEKYYRKDRFDEADLVIIHDPGEGFFENSVDLLSEMLISSRDGISSKNRLIVMEGHSEDRYFAPSGGNFPNEMRQVEIQGQYGHCDGVRNDYVGEVKSCAYSSARLFLLNDPALLAFASSYQNSPDLSLAIFTPPRRVYRQK